MIPHKTLHENMLKMRSMNAQVRKPLQSLVLWAFYIEREIPQKCAEMCCKYIGKEAFAMQMQMKGRGPPGAKTFSCYQIIKQRSKLNEYQSC